MRLILLLLLFVLLHVSADEHSHTYDQDEDVIVWVNTVGPYANRQETYAFFQLPYCLGSKIHDHRHETLGEALQGMELVNSGIELHFKQNMTERPICEKYSLDRKHVETFMYAVEKNYWYQMYIDELPVWGFVGIKDEKGDLFLYTHKHFNITYNQNHIIHVEVVSSKEFPLKWKPDATDPVPIAFTYSVEWTPTTVDYDRRFEKYLDSKFFEHNIHWVSVVNSFVIVLFLTGSVALILIRTLNRDLARYGSKDFDNILDHDMDEYGWKQVHGDVFRPPPRLSLLSGMVGSGLQLALMLLILLLFTITMDLYRERSSILTATIVIYILKSIFGGFISGQYYMQYSGKQWIRTLFWTAGLWPAAVSLASFTINLVAIYYTSAKAIPFGSMVALICIWIFLVFPLTLLGTLLGRNYTTTTSTFPTRINPIPRPIPEGPWYTDTFNVMVLTGLLPFGSIFIEMYFVMSSFWAYKIYYVYGFLLLVSIMLWIVTACATVVCVYTLLNTEDYRHWTSFLAGGSISIYVFLYSIYYFFARTKMYGLFQTTFYFGYTGVYCLGLFLMCGAIGHVAASWFVRRIYANVKID